MMSVQDMLKTSVEVFRDDKPVLQTKVRVLDGEIYFGDVDIKELDIVIVSGMNEVYKIFKIRPRQNGNKVLYKKALVEVIEI